MEVEDRLDFTGCRIGIHLPLEQWVSKQNIMQYAELFSI